ncbi:L-threonylcarbamoyladenylate synthase [Pleurocapsales cyanobacterium LEGE 06147]|nr:L-threonylcarbamoyladenylate synthase [Pleurocapsales cyanobacterium LEGE 06147]
MTIVSQTELIAGILAGKVVSFPTDTVPALAVKPELARQIFTIKKRSSTKPLILMGASFADLLPYVTGTEAELAIWQKVTQKFWPGALTLVLPASNRVPREMNPTDPNTIGIRVPNLAVARKILHQTGPLATTSANLSGQAPLVKMSAIEIAFPDVLVLDEQELSEEEYIGSGLPSTVAKWTGTDWQILRQGIIKINEVNAAAVVARRQNVDTAEQG